MNLFVLKQFINIFIYLLQNNVQEDESLEPLLENVNTLIKLLEEEELKQTDHKGSKYISLVFKVYFINIKY